ncbi:unnamed protein product [Caenorhabditis bovis]|uniref:Uncharacterized protein n=1 Tax=Caenorhabditis bovis TaxID=2654633 RepID=A0A8S1ELX3_9PELO|nr:unnamed protein product [Caenorhabditis bovis]
MKGILLVLAYVLAVNAFPNETLPAVWKPVDVCPYAFQVPAVYIDIYKNLSAHRPVESRLVGLIEEKKMSPLDIIDVEGATPTFDRGLSAFVVQLCIFLLAYTLILLDVDEWFVDEQIVLYRREEVPTAPIRHRPAFEAYDDASEC